MIGSRFPRRLVLIQKTLRVFKVRTCTFTPQNSGRAKARRVRPFAMAMELTKLGWDAATWRSLAQPQQSSFIWF